MNILCRTLFDCSRTGTTGHFRIGAVPYADATGTVIRNIGDWTLSRNQQRNFETILQMISLRAQPDVVSDPVEQAGMWSFEFAVESAGVYSATGQLGSTDALTAECAGTPMIVGLREQPNLDAWMITQGHRQNIWFEPINN